MAILGCGHIITRQARLARRVKMAPYSLALWYTVFVLLIIITRSVTQKQSMMRADNKTTPGQDVSQNAVCINDFANCPVLPEECETKDKKKLYIMAMAPYPVPESEGSPPSWAGGPEVIPGALLAACHINCDSTILPNYTIELVITDGGCNINTRAFSNFVWEVFLSQGKPQNVVGIIGGGCSESSFTVGSLVSLNRLSLLQISPSATSPTFISEIHNYPNTFRLTVSARGYSDAFQAMIKLKGYKEVAILYEATRSYMVNVYNHFAQALRNKGVKADKTFGLLPSYLEQPLKELEKKVRFIFVLVGGNFAQQILCLAYHKNMSYPDYQFVFINRRQDDFLKEVKIKQDGEVTFVCNRSQMDLALSAATLFEFRVTRQDKDTPTFSGYTYNEAQCPYRNTVQEHKRLLNLSTVGTVSTEFQNTYYDATWALALSLHNANVMGVNLANYTYGQPGVTKAIREQLLNVSFEGLSGKVQFSNETLDGSEVTIIDIFQRPSNSSEFRLVGYYDPEKGLNKSDDIYFVKNPVFDRTFAHPPSALGYVFIAIAVVVGLGIVILHYLNVGWGDLKTVKASSPQLNHLIFSGCYLILLDVVLLSAETAIVAMTVQSGKVIFGVLCNAQVWAYSLFISLVFGTICVKTWRIFKIFSHLRAKPINHLGNANLIGFVVCLVSVDTVYLIAWNSVNPLVMYISNEQPHRAICMCDNFTYWISFLVGYKVVLLLFVLYLSISTRHVNRPEFKQTKSINTLIYILVIVTALGVVPYAITIASGTTNLVPIIAVYVTLSVSCILSAIICAVFVFLPPIYPLLKNKVGQ